MLTEAAAAVEQTPWPEPVTVSLMSRMLAGAAQADGISRDEAITVYVRDLAEAGSGFEALSHQAAQNVEAVYALVVRAEDAAGALNPAMADVAIVEKAIQSARENRNMFIAAAENLRDSGGAVSSDEILALRNEFNDGIRALSRVADDLAAAAAAQRMKSFAAPEPGRITNRLVDS